MFDKDIYLTDIISIDIKQQPNDAADAARLYGEIKKETIEELKSAMTRSLSGINAEFIQANFNPQDYCANIWFKVNGVQLSVKVEERGKIKHEFYQGIFKAISDCIAAEIMEGYMKNPYRV